MKKLLILPACLLLLAFSGPCSTTSPQPPPSALDNAIFKITTNVTTITNVIIQTNLAPVTNAVGQVVIITNLVPVPVVVERTNFVYQTGGRTESAANALGAALTAFGVPGGGLIGAGLIGLVGLWGTYKSRQATTLGTIAGNSTQVIQVARNLIAASPNGSAIAAKFDAWLIAHQQDANIANEVAAVVDQFVNPKDKEFVSVAETIVKEATTPL